MYDCRSVGCGDTPDNVSCERSRYDARFCALLCSEEWLSILIPLTIGNSAQEFPPIHFTAYQLCVFTRHRKVEIAYTAISLFYGSPFRSTLFSQLIGRHNDRPFVVSGRRRPRDQAWVQGLQGVKDSSGHSSRLDSILPGHLLVSLSIRDYIGIGEGKHSVAGDRGGTDIPPANYPTLAGSVSVRFETRQ